MNEIATSRSTKLEIGKFKGALSNFINAHEQPFKTDFLSFIDTMKFFLYT